MPFFFFLTIFTCSSANWSGLKSTAEQSEAKQQKPGETEVSLQVKSNCQACINERKESKRKHRKAVICILDSRF